MNKGLKEKIIELRLSGKTYNEIYSILKCGYDKCINALEFHHEDPKIKKFAISSYKYLSWDKIKEELDKCVLICSNCYRELHWEINNKK